MSIFRMPTLSHISTRFEGLRGRLGRGSQLGAKHQKTRRLALDPLEQRQLLSVSPADWTDIRVNQTVSEDELAFVGFNQYGENWWDVPQSMAMDDDGDFVVAWTRYDQVADTNGNPVIDPATGLVMRDANVYARYFTDEVQRIAFPEQLASDNIDDQYGSFYVKYGGNEVQQLTISATYEPVYSNAGSGYGYQNNIVGGITLGFDVTGDGIIGAGETATIFYNETNLMATTAAELQTALQGLGGALADVTVQPVTPTQYEIHFGDFSQGNNQPEITVEATNFTNGFLPAVQVETLRDPTVLGPIYVSPDDPYMTATSIEEVFRLTTTDFHIAPYEFPSYVDTLALGLGPYSAPQTIRHGIPTVSVEPVWKTVYNPSTGKSELQPSLTEFEITFDGAVGAKEGSAGKIDHPELTFVSATDDAGNPVNVAAEGTVRTIKEPSPEFRVNPPEPENPFTPLPDKFDQLDAAVAMDADGDFIITWESEIPDWQLAGSVSDIYARQFTPVGLDAPDELEFVPGIIAKGDAFRVNTKTEGIQGDPSVGVDGQGNFTVAWGSGAQDLSYFNSIRARSFDRFGNATSSEYQVNVEDTSIHFNPYVAVSESGDNLNDPGYALITWVETDDESYLFNQSILVSTQGTIFDNEGNTLRPIPLIGGGGRPKAAWDKDRNFIITWEQANSDVGDAVGNNSPGVRGTMYHLNSADLNYTLDMIRPEFLVNSAYIDDNFLTPDLNREATWPYWQFNGHPALDADGDLTVMYEGFAPDVSVNVSISSQFYADATADPANADLLQYFPFGFRLATTPPISNGVQGNIDVDQSIEQELIRVANAGATLEQIGRIRAILESKADLLRGEHHAIMYSQFDADPQLDGNLSTANDNIIFSDNVANATRDGHNQRWILLIDTGSTGGNFVIRMANPYVGGTEDVQVSPVYTNSALNVNSTRDAIENALRAATRTGNSWPSTNLPWEGPVEVRIVSRGFGTNSQEILDRQVVLSDGSQPWAYPYDLLTMADTAIFEITFQGEVHDTGMSMGIVDNNLSPDGQDFLRLDLYQDADAGTDQKLGTMDIEPDGDFTVVWMQEEERTSDTDGGTMLGASTHQNIYYRRFDEGTDTAGPRVTDLVDHSGNQVVDGGAINGAVRHIVVTFDEALMNGDPNANPASVLSTANWQLTQEGVVIPGAIAKVEFGMNKAAELNGTYDGVGDSNGGQGQIYDLSPVPTNKYEAVITFDANGNVNSGDPRLGIGTFVITATNGLQDTKGNPLGSFGPLPGGFNMSREFNVKVDQPDIPIDENAGSTNLTSATTHPESPNAVAVDSDGDYVVVWTAYDSTAGHDRVYWRLFDADGSPADLPVVNAQGQWTGNWAVDAAPIMPITPNQAGSEFVGNVQRYGSAAIDPDGDFVITWTNYRDGDADVYARTFPARAVVQTTNPNTGLPEVALSADVSDPFRVNGYTADNQKWSDVAMDKDGDFIVVWSSYAQELDGQLGSGYGIYARRYDSEGRALASELQVNVTTAGNQITPSVAMAAWGDFVVAWTSDQNGLDDDIIVREFNADGSAKAGPLQGERLVNDIEAGHQRYPDVAMRFDGVAYVVTWTDSAADTSGTSVWAELSSPQPKRYLDPVGHGINATHNFTITVPDNYIIADLNVQLGNLFHDRLPDLEVLLTHGGVTVRLFDDLPRAYLNPPYGRPNYNIAPVMAGTYFDDEAPTSIRITDSDLGAIPPYAGTFVPQQVLTPFNGMNAQGAWTLTVIDRNPGNGLAGSLNPISPSIGSWNLDITEETQTYPSSFQVNSTSIGHQMFSSVAMDTFGEFVVTWSGRGEESQDTSGHGVYYQRYDRGGQRVGYQTQVNLDQAGDQWMSSIGMNAAGNFVIAWTGAGALPGTSAVYKFDSIRNFPQEDNEGPFVTDMYAGTQRIFNGSVIVAPSNTINQITVVFNEELSQYGGVSGPHSVLNPNNWAIVRNGAEIVGGISNVTFGLNPLTNKWEAVVTFDGNGINFGTPGLDQGEYVLTVRDQVTDASRFISVGSDPNSTLPGNILDGDIDGVAGSQPITLGLGGYEHYFSIAAGAQIGPEFRINENVNYEQRISAPGGLGQAREESNRSVAVDHDGDFAVVWTTYGIDDPTDPFSGGVYLRLYDRNDNPITGEILVNQNVSGHQRNASIAMDADGDFVVVWESEGTSFDGSWDVFARRYDSMGRALGDEFRVNSTTPANQVNPTVAMDDRGAFVIAWATSGQDFSFFNDVYAQRYDRFGVAQGAEFRVNVNDLPGAGAFPPGRFEINPSAAMSGPSGDFVIAWEIVTSQQNGVATNTVIGGRLFNSIGTALSGEIRLDSGPGTGGLDQYRVARNPQMVMNDQGGFYLVWESYVVKMPAYPNDYDVFYSEFSAGGGLVASGQLNQLQFIGHQVNPSIGVDADGDFSAVWNGPGATVDPLFPTNPDYQVDEDDNGIFKLDFNPANQTVGSPSRVNRTAYGDQIQPTIGVEPDGDSIVVWAGVGVGDNHGIFARRYNETLDTAGPTVSDWADERGNSLDNGHIFEGTGNEVQYLVLTFDEDMMAFGDDSVTNPLNYALLRGGITVPGSIVSVEYGLNKASELAGTVDPRTGKVYQFNGQKSNKYEAILTFDGDLATSGLQPLEDASYTIQALAAVPGFRSGLRDVSGNVQYRTGLTPTGRDFVASFVVQIEEPPPPPQPDPPTVTEGGAGTAVDLDAILVNQVYSDYQYTSPGRSLAVDNDGDFVVTWTRYDAVDNNGNPIDANIYARYFTDEVQRLTLPNQLAHDTDGAANTLGSFTLEYNAAEIQMLSITSGVQPFTSNDLDGTADEDEVGQMSGSFVLGYDLTGDGTVGDDPGVNERVTVSGFTEANMVANAAAIQRQLRLLGGPLAGVTVRAVNPRDYLIEFAAATAGLDVSEISVESQQLVQAYLPAVSVATLREGMVFQNIRVSADNPNATAASIENAIRGLSEAYGPIGPVDFPPPNRVTATSTEAPYTAPWWTKSYAPEVQVTPVVKSDGTLSLTEFDITFVGSSGKQDHPQLALTNARNDQGLVVSVPSSAVVTRKEPSNEFRVNPAEPDDPATAGNDAYNQTNPSVAIDADGDFVIVWESEIPNTKDFGSVSDIFAQRFTPFGKTTAAIPGEMIDIFGGSTGIRALVNPEVQDVQRLIFNANDPFGLPLTGTFRLQLGDTLTSPISFNSANLRATADDIVAKLADAGIEGVTVVQVPTSTTGLFRLEVRFGGASAGVDQPTLQYVADVTPLAATVTVEDMPVDMYTINVNQDKSNPQFDPSVAMDESGAFVVTWANGGQLLSYFNHISVQRFNRDGERVGNEFQVNAETTDIQFAPSVALSNSGNFIVTWSATADAEYALSQTFTANVRAKVFDATGNQMVGEFSVGGGGASMAAFDSDDNYVITWHGLFDNLAGVVDAGVHARQFALYNSAGQANNTPVEIRPEFRVNSSSTNLADPVLWPYNQYNAQPAIDADGDLAVIYEGFGPDVSVNVSMAAGYFTTLMSKPQNEDLWVYFDPFNIYERGQEGVPVTMITKLLGNNGSVDAAISQVLFRATELGATDMQLGRLRAILEQTVGQLRGEANGILLSQWDADPTLSSQLVPLFSDSVVNSYRDGQNQRSYLEIPMQFSLTDANWYQAERGTFTVQVTNLLTGQTEIAVVDIASNGMGQPLSIEGTRQNLEAALQGMAILGTAWPGVNEGTVDIREVEPDEIIDRTATDWEIDEVDETLYEERAGGVFLVQGFRHILYEIEFQGSSHDTPFDVQVIGSATERGAATVDQNGNVTYTWVAGPPVGPAFFGDTYGTQGTWQTRPSIGMEPDGDYTTLYTQVENYRNAGFVTAETSTANMNIYYRRFDEETDTAGPRVTNWAEGTGNSLDDNAVLQKHLQYVVLTFDEEMLSGDPAQIADSILNSANFKLFESNVEVEGGVINVAFGLSKAAELAGQADPLTGGVYDLNPIPSNKWEAVITLDGDVDLAGAQPLRDGFYSFQALASVTGSSTVPGHSGLRDRAGNTLYHTGFDPAGADFNRAFSIKVTERKDEPVSESATASLVKNGHTNPESPGAIAADADGQYVVVWTATDAAQGNREKIFYRLYDSDGTPADLPIVDNQTGQPILGIGNLPIVVQDAFPALPLTPSSNVLPGFEQFAADTQTFATVAMDKDGDFVVTWTNYRAGNADIYARRFDSLGEVAGVDEIGNVVFKGGSNNPGAVSDPFRVNGYTTGAQKWSNVAMDVDGDFIVTWSSYGQEDGGRLGLGYGVYARRYDSFGQSLASEFQVNVTEAGDQQFSNVAMDSQGGFTIAWTSDQNGISDDIIVRDFNPDGTPVGGPLGGEVVANQTLAGDQRYPDIAMNLAGDQYVVTWSASGQDGSGWGVYGRLFNRSNTTLYVPSSPAMSIPDTGTVEATLNVSNNSIITDLNVRIELRHASPADLDVHLISPTGTDVQLFANVPGPLTNGTLPKGSDFSGTLFDDAAAVAIDDPDNGAVPPFAGTFQPMGALAAFNGENSNGQWRLRITDANGNDRSGLLEQWSLIIERSPVPEQEFRVNTTSVGNQMYSSVAMDHQGEFVVTWSGFGNQPEHADPSGSGVFLQRFEATGNRIGDESRVNMTTDGDQKVPSVSSDGVGNYYVAFTGVRRDATGNNIPGETDVYVLASKSTLILQDNDPPIVTDVRLADGTRLLQGDVIAPATNKLVVVFSESMSRSGMTSVKSISNWELERNGSELTGAIQSVDFSYNATTRKYEAVVTLAPSVLPLTAGQYLLTASSVITDNVNSLDGDLDGIPGSNPTTTTQPGYQFSFNVSNTSSGAGVGAEYRVNTETVYQDQFSSAHGTGTARETSSTTLAVDHDGDYAVVWTRSGADDPLDLTGTGVYLRLFDRNDNALTGEIQVNTITSGDQRNPSVAIDADGDLVVVWESESASIDGSYDVFARRFNSVGVPRDTAEFRVNTDTQQDQVNPAVAIDNSGNFVVVWATKGKNAGFSNDVHGQIYNKEGEPQGFEFLVNGQNLTGINPPADGSFEINPAVGMSGATGSFVVAWEVVTAQQNGVVIDTVLAARQFTAEGVPLAAEFAADTGVGTGGTDTQRVARNPQVAVDDRDGFIIVWESYTGADYDVFFQQFDATGASLADDQVNMAQFVGQQVNPSVGIDVDGDFSIVFNGAGARPDPLNPANTTLYTDVDSEGVWLRSYNSTAIPMSVQSRVNITTGGIQQFPTIGMEPDGSYVVAWSGRGVGDHYGVFVRRYESAVDLAGPIVSDLVSPSGKSISDGDQITDQLTQLVIVFDEEMMTTGPDRVTNPANYRLVHDGTLLSNVITNIEFGLNPETNKWEAVLTLDGNGGASGVVPLDDGQYQLTVLNSVRDKVGNPLGATGLNPKGSSISWTFNLLGISSDVNQGETLISQGLGGEFTRPYATQAVASDADGDTVTVWTSKTPGQQGIYARLTQTNWTESGGDRIPTTVELPVILVTQDATADFASVAMDGDGDFVVTWSQENTTTSWDVYARRYDSMGNPLGDAFMVNEETDDVQRYSSVAMDVDGDFVITWQSADQDGSGYGIYGQRFDAVGGRLGGSYEVQVIQFTGSPKGTFKLRFEGRTTNAISYAGNLFAIAATVEAELGAIGADVEVEPANFTNLGIRFRGEEGLRDQQQILVVDAVITGDPGARITATTQVDGTFGEFRVNDTVENDQVFPCVAADADGTFIVTWTGFGQDGDAPDQSNIYAKQFVSNDAFLASSISNYKFDSLADLVPGLELSTTTDSPTNHIVSPGTGYDGVVQVLMPGGGLGSGSLLYTGRHILTAAHVVDDGTGNPWPSIDVVFELPDSTRFSMSSSVMYIHPGWTGDLFDGNDVAIIVLPEEAPIEADRYDIYRGSSELNREFTIAGYGTAGQGAEQFLDGQKRFGTNEFEAYGEALNGHSYLDFVNGLLGPGTFNIPSGNVLLYDFDSGLAANDALGMALGIRDTGLGVRESCAAHGDSGGPALINGVIAGVASGILEYTNADSTPLAVTDASFGTVGFHARVSAFADWIDQIAQSTTSEFLVNANQVDPLTGAILVDNQAYDQRWSSVALDADGDFVITWTNYAPSTGTGSGIGGQDPDGVYARRFDSTTIPVSEVFQVNVTATDEQQFSRVAMDADGDFVITWESSTPAGFDVYAQRYVRNAALTQTGSTAYGANGEIGGQFVVNATKTGDQRYPGIAMDDTGDYIIVWSGNGNQPGEVSTQGVFGQRLLKADDDAGPTVTDSSVALLSNGTASVARLIDGDTFEESVTAIVLTFGEDLNVLGGDAGRESVLNLNNWQLTRYRSATEGTQIVAGGITDIQFFLDPSTNKYQAVIFVDDDPSLTGSQPLARGTYVLTARDTIEDLFENRLDGNYDGAPGAPFSISFTIDGNDAPLPYPGTPGEDDEDVLVHNESDLDQFDPAVARAADGRYVVVWTSMNDPALDDTGAPIVDLADEPIVYTNVYARMFDRYGEPTSGEILVSTYTTGPQSRPDVAIDDYGNFVVVWEGEGQGTDEKLDQTGIFARVFDAHGQGGGDQILVNVNRDGLQTQPAVAMNAMGQFVVTWLSHDHGGIIARQFTLDGTGGAEFRVNTTTGNNHQYPDVAMDNDGDFAVTWTSAEQDNGSMGVFAQRFSAAGAKLGGEFMVNQYQTDRQEMSRIAMDDAGNFVIAWQSMGQDAFGGYGVYARRYSAAGTALSNEFRVNDFTAGYQFEPAVSMDADGDFVVTWSSFKQEGDKGELYGIFAKMYNADGTLFVLPGQTAPIGEYRVNADIEGDQRDSDVSMDADGHYAIVWEGTTTVQIPDPDAPTTLITVDQSDVYARVVDPPVETAADSTTLNLFGTPGIDTFEFVAGATPSTWVVKINGVAQTVASAIQTVNFDGMGGNDIVILTGTNGAEKVYAKPGEVQFIGSNFTVNATDVENVTVDGKGGADYAELRDSAGNDSLIMRVGETIMVGTGYSNKVLNFEEVHGYGLNGGLDEAKLYDSDGMDRFVGTPTYARMFGDGYMHRAKGFRFVHGYSTKGTDRAELHDGAGNDLFKYDDGLAKLWGSGFYLRAKNFDKVETIADGGGNDYARVFDTKSVDKFVGTPTSARMYSTEADYDVTTRLFEKVLAQSTAGGKDIARFYDSANKEVFIGHAHKAEYSGNRFEITARKFERVEAHSTPGSNDIAKFRDTSGNDHLIAIDDSASMYMKNGSEMELLYQAFAFDLVKTYRSTGSDTKDVAASVVDKVLLDDGWVDD
ncbi:MAG: hypothetical protein GXX96_31110 [Planctomycetaceae bacterium]|nr:hypothetical protein [Planctomycetaceae bacterium]